MLENLNFYQKNFGTFEDIAGSFGDKYIDIFAGKITNAAFACMQDERTFSGLEAVLDDIGFRKFKVFNAGTHSMVLETTKGQLVKIFSLGGEPSIASKTGVRGASIPECSAVLQPIQTFDVGEFRIAIMPEVQREPSNGFMSEVFDNAICQKLAEDGLFSEDMDAFNVRQDNIGFLDDDTPVIIDAGSLSHISNVKDNYLTLMNKRLNKFKAYKHDYTWELDDGTWKQHEEFPHIWNSGKPEAGQLRGVYPRDEIEAARADIGDNAVKEEILGEVASGYGEDAARRVVEAAEEQGRLDELRERITGNSK